MFEKRRSSNIPILIMALLMLVAGFYIGKMLENKENKEVLKTVEAETEAGEKENAVVLKKDAVLIFRTKYNKCEHFKEKKENIKDVLVGVEEKKLKEYVKFNYPGWKVEKFSEKEVALYKEIDSYCDEHYEIGEENGNIVIYKYDANGKKEVVEKTQFSTTYLPQVDQEQIKAGIVVDSIEKVREILEDYAS